MKTDLMNIIFGLKVRKARNGMEMSLSAFARECKLSASYLTEIEKGRKYPKRDKIVKISQVTGIDYDELVSIRLAPSLQHLESALNSPLISDFPFEEFGVELGTLVDLLTTAPDRVSALIHAIFEIGRRYDMKEEHFLRAAMRSYQEMHDNHFPEIEDAAEEVMAEYGFTVPLSRERIEQVLTDEFGFAIDYDTLAGSPDLETYRSVTVLSRNRHLLINSRLSEGQIKFAMLREMGMVKLGLKKRAYTSPPQVVESFEQVTNDFKASYFAGAMMMPREQMLEDIEAFFGQDIFKPELLSAFIIKYHATPEMLCYRLSELIPQHFGVDLHFLRFEETESRYSLVKQLNLNNLPLPSGFGEAEHFCRRWLTVRLLKDMKRKDNVSAENPHVGVQLSEFLNKGSRFLCFGFSRPISVRPGTTSSVILGFRVTNDLRHTIRFVEDPNIPQTMLADTCERCPLTREKCSLRACEPTILQQERAQEDKRAALKALRASLRT